MIYWITFHFSIIFLCILFLYTKKNLYQIIIASLICCILIYFSAFKTGIGQDVEQYIKRLGWLSSIEMLSVRNEPLFNLISYIIDKTRFSYLFLFLVSAIVTNVGIVLFCLKEKKYFPYMILLFIFFPVLYQQQFNLVRQFFALGFFYYSLRYVGVSIWRYFICVIIAGLMHFTAVFLFPLYWIINRRYERKWLLVISIVFYLFIPFVLNYVGQMDRYESYINIMTTKTMYMSGFTILYNIIILIFLFNNRLYNSINPIYLNLLILLVLFMDASYINYGFYRFAIYFIPIIIYIVPYIFDKLWNKTSVSFFIAALILLFYINATGNSSSEKIELLPLSALFDK